MTQKLTFNTNATDSLGINSFAFATQVLGSYPKKSSQTHAYLNKLFDTEPPLVSVINDIVSYVREKGQLKITLLKEKYIRDPLEDKHSSIRRYFMMGGTSVVVLTLNDNYLLEIHIESLQTTVDHDKIHNLINEYCRPLYVEDHEKEDEKSYINFICRDSNGFYLEEFEVSENLEFSEIFDNYEESFKEEFSDKVLDKLTDNSYNKGIVLLYGEPGTGKTTYLRYLLSRIRNKQVMYLPPEMSSVLSDPSFITFLMKNPNSVLIIEDAENIIKQRKGGDSQAVSNILNITDGILGSAVKYQVICTFNAPYTEIDHALKRKGRLIGQYEFKKLSAERTKFLVKKIHGENVVPTTEEMTIAEIHNMFE